MVYRVTKKIKYVIISGKKTIININEEKNKSTYDRNSFSEPVFFLITYIIIVDNAMLQIMTDNK